MSLISIQVVGPMPVRFAAACAVGIALGLAAAPAQPSLALHSVSSIPAKQKAPAALPVGWPTSITAPSQGQLTMPGSVEPGTGWG